MAALSSSIAVALDDKAQSEARTVAAFAGKALADWTGSVFSTWKIKRAVSNRQVLGANAGLKRKEYAMSPVFSIIGNQCMKETGTVYVVHAEAGMGKTTALYAVMGRVAKKGVAFSPAEVSGDYSEVMLRRLHLDTKNPPDGWLNKFLEELQTPWSEGPAILILDDFMNENSGDALDRSLLKNIKVGIRDKNIVVFVFTTNEQSANLMITWNGMNSIVPAAPSDAVRRWQQKIREHEKSGAQTEFSINWHEGNRMRWETDELKKAVLANPQYMRKGQGEKKIVGAEMDAFIGSLDQEELEFLNPSTVLRHLCNQLEKQQMLMSWNPPGMGGVLVGTAAVFGSEAMKNCWRPSPFEPTEKAFWSRTHGMI